MLTKRGIVVTWKTLGAGVVVLLACIGAFSLVQAQQQKGDAKIPALTAADRLEIQELLHRYMFVLDSCPDHNNGYDGTVKLTKTEWCFPLEAKVLALDQPAQVTASQTWNARFRSNRW